MKIEFPNGNESEKEFAEYVANKVLDEYLIEGLSLRKWIGIAGDYAALQANVHDAIQEMTLLERHKIRPISYDQELAVGMCIDILKKHIHTVAELRKDDDN